MTPTATSPAPPQVSIVIVCMNNPENLFPCLDSIRKQTRRVSYEIRVVAYLFSRENRHQLQVSYPDVHVIESNEIRGFSENNNLALRQAQGEFCLILNDDTLMEMPVADRLVASFQTEPRASIFSPKILNPDGSVQTCGRIPYTMGSSLLNGFRLRDASRVRSPYINQQGIFQSYNISGAAFMIRTDVLKKLGYFDEQYFFCPEDIALSTLANERGYFCYVNADVTVVHLACATLSQTMTATFPALARGIILFHGRKSKIKGRIFSICVFILAALKFVYAFRKPPESRNTWRRAWRNTMVAAFSPRSPKEIFCRYYTRRNHPSSDSKPLHG